MRNEVQLLMIDADIHQRLERVAAETGHSASALASGVLRDFLDEDDAYVAAIQEGIDDVEAGHVVSFEEVKADVEMQLAALTAKAQSRASSTETWSPEFFERLNQADAETLAALEESVEVVRQNRRSKPPLQWQRQVDGGFINELTPHLLHCLFKTGTCGV